MEFITKDRIGRHLVICINVYFFLGLKFQRFSHLMSLEIASFLHRRENNRKLVIPRPQWIQGSYQEKYPQISLNSQNTTKNLT